MEEEQEGFWVRLKFRRGTQDVPGKEVPGLISEFGEAPVNSMLGFQTTCPDSTTPAEVVGIAGKYNPDFILDPGLDPYSAL